MKKILLFLLIVLAARTSMAQVVHVEGFESGSMPPTGWTELPSTVTPFYWSTVTTGNCGYPSVTVSPIDGSQMGYFNSYSDDYTGSSNAQTICSPSFTRTAIGSATDSVSFWMYRDGGYSSDADEITVYINTAANLTGATSLGTVARSKSIATPSTVTANGWYRYAFVVPSGFSGSVNYLLVQAISQYGNNMFIDDITWTEWAPDCAGAPTAGQIAGPSSVCPSIGYNLHLIDDSVASGLTYQWYSSASGAGSFSAISGATNSNYSAASLTAATDYEVVVTCVASGIADTTAVYTMSQTPFYNCYCGPYTTGTILDNYSGISPIDSFAIGGTTLHNGTPTSTAVYTSFVPTTPTTTGTMLQGSTYTAYVNSANTSGYTYNAYMWIDYNHSGSFDADEYYQIVSGGASGTTSAYTFIVSPTADTGVTGLRLRVSYQYSTISGGGACTNVYDGVTNDYDVTIGAGIPCTGAPASGTAFASRTSVCESGSFNLYDTAYANGLGIEYQWYSRPAGVGAYSALYGGGSVAVTGVTQTDATDYILVVKCDSSSISDTSNVVTVTMSPFYLCYCSPLVGVTLDNSTSEAVINTFSIAGTTLNNPTPSGAPVYTQYWPTTPTTTGTMNQGNSYTASINVTSGPYDDYTAIMWIDYDHSGAFEDGSLDESVIITNDGANNSTATTSFIMPSTSDTGLTGLRVRTVPYYGYSYFGTGNSCSNEYDGTVEDYVITIAPGVPCTGAPNAGGAMSSSATICSTSSFTISDTGFENGLGIEYQWYSRDSGTTAYAPLYGGASTTVSGVSQSVTTDYIFVVKCDSSGISDTSNVLTVGMSPFYLCYCSPLTGTTLDNSTYASVINNFGITSTTLSNPTPSGAPLYTQYWPTTPSTTTDLNQGNTYTAYINVNSSYDDYTAIMWLDQDASGTFDAGEATVITNDGIVSTTTSAAFTVPGTTPVGYTGLRVRSVPYYGYPYFGTGNACTNEYDGTTEDYVVNIIPGVPCTGTPSAGTAFAPSTICDDASFNLSDTGLSNGLGIVYQWYSRPSGTGTYSPVYGGSTAFVSGVSQEGATDYILVTTCDSSGFSDSSNVVTVASSPFYLCYCSPASNSTTLGTDGEYATMDSVSILGTTFSHYITPSSSSYIAFQTDSSTVLNQLSTYTMDINVTDVSYGDDYTAGMWIDYNHDGTFTSDEYYSIANDAPNPSSSTVSFLVPLTAQLGVTGLRVRSIPYYYTLGSGDACTNDYESQTYDYLVTIGPAPVCAGAPTAGAAVASVGGACTTTGIVLSDPASETASGLTYQWQSATDSATFTDISGATTEPYTYTGLTTTTQFRVKVTCSVSGLVDSSTMINVVFGPCVCVPTYDYYSSSYPYGVMDNFTVTDDVTSFSDNMPSSALTTGYADRTGVTTLDFTTGHTYTGSVSYYYGESEVEDQIWIDANDNGTFETSEEVTGVFGNPDGVYTATSPFTMDIPVTMAAGLHRMRVRNATMDYPYYGVSADMDPCAVNDATNTYYQGITADYFVNLTPAPACSGTPSTGTVVSSTSSACVSTPITLSAPGITIATALAYQWEISTDGSTWADIAGATTTPYSFVGDTTTTYYRLVLTCSTTGAGDTSNAVSVTNTPCYCTTPSWTFGGTVTGDAMDEFVAAGAGGTSLDDAGIAALANPTTGYLDHTGLTPLAFMQGGTYPITITYNESSYGWENQVWIDFNNDGTFDAAVGDTVSPVFGVAPSGSYVTSNSSVITIPATATPGYHRMRVRNTWMQFISYTAFSNPMDPCSAGDVNVNYGDGDVVDYTVLIVPTYCDSVTGITVSGITGTSATGSWTTDTGAGYEYVVSTSATTPTTAGTATIFTHAALTGLTPGTTYYLFVRNSCGAGEFSVWESTSFTTDCDTVSGVTISAISDTSATVSWTAAASSSAYEYVISTSPTAPSVGAATTTATSVTVTTLTPGVVYYAYVRNICATGSTSTWNSATFTTSICDSILASVVTVSADDTGVIFSFTGATGDMYYYTVNTSATAPTSGGTATTSTTDTVTGLTPGNSYYIHLRAGCGSGFSSWTNVPFTTGICDSVSGLTVTSTSDTGLVFTFATASGVFGYYYTVDESPAAPAGLGTFTTSNVDTVTGLTPGTIYYVHVRTSCGGGYSTWTAVTSPTTPCDTAAVTVYANDTFAYVTWVAEAGAAGYNYVINTVPTSPAGGGTFTTSNADTILSGLTPGTTYYAHVQVVCGGGNYSGWVNVPFTLSPCDTTTAALINYDNTTHTATIDWIYQAGAGYNYALNTTPGVPTSGIASGPASDTNAVYPGLTPNTTYYFHIQVICTTGLGASSSSWITVSFTTPPPVSVTNVNNTEFGIQAFPNPAINVVTVKVTGNAAAHRVVELTDVTGKILKRVDMAASQVDVDMSDVAAGIYLIKYVDDDHSQVVKINKQ